MSQGQRMTLETALGVVEYVTYRLRDSVERIEVAGSVRRGKPDVGDIELVCVPRFEDIPADLFGETRRVNRLDWRIEREGWPVVKGGERYKQFVVLGRYTVDLFIQPDPATWGVNFTLRTGSSDFAHWLVTPRAKGGALPFGMFVKDAWLWEATDVTPLATPEEADFFRLIGVGWVEPRLREAGRWGAFSKVTPIPVDKSVWTGVE